MELNDLFDLLQGLWDRKFSSMLKILKEATAIGKTSNSQKCKSRLLNAHITPQNSTYYLCNLIFTTVCFNPQLFGHSPESMCQTECCQQQLCTDWDVFKLNQTLWAACWISTRFIHWKKVTLIFSSNAASSSAFLYFSVLPHPWRHVSSQHFNQLRHPSLSS